MSDLAGLITIAADNTASEVAISGNTLAVLLYALGKIDEPQAWADYRGEVFSQADIETIHDLVDRAADEVMNPIMLVYPNEFYISALSAILTSSGSILRSAATAQLLNIVVEVTPFTAAGNSLDWNFYAQKGAWTIKVLGTRNTNCGNVTMNVDSVAWQTRDNYNAAGANNIEYSYSGNILTDGNHTLRLYVGSKNAASSSYRFLVSAIYGHRTGDLP